ncbi:MAG TPA: hypothetical protein VI757_08115 [Bacteroidia bacterium]|nr:hypothetical protein [Bacteroidia bacterium]
MKAKELRALTRWQRMALVSQAKRIKLLEDKVEEIRKKYFALKYPDDIMITPRSRPLAHN